MTATQTASAHRCCEHTDLWHDGHGCLRCECNCGGCADARKAAKVRAEALPDYRLRVVPDLCGECDERWIETPSGLAKCPRCYPKEMAS